MNYMAIVNEIKCARCDRKYSGVRSRCPYCGARRIGRGKYSEGSDNARGKMMISVLIMAVFTVAAGILLFTTPVDAVDPEIDQEPEILSPEDEIVAVAPIIPDITPEPEEVEEPALPLGVTSVQIWLGNDFRINEEFTLSRGEVLQLRGVIEPPGMDVELHWEDTDNDSVFTWEPIVGGIRISHAGAGNARITLTAGDQSETLIVRGR